MANLAFPICALLIISLLNIIFYSKKRIQNADTEIYRKMLFLNLLESITACIIVIILINLGTKPIVYLLDKIDYILIISEIYVLYLYVKEVLKKGENIKSKISKIIYYLSIGCILILPIEVINKDGIIDTAGPSSTTLYITSIFFLILMAINIIKSRKKTPESQRKKLIPMYVLIFFGIIMVIVRYIWPEILLISLIIAYALLVMYFTIENPDVKLLTEVEIAKDKAEKANAAKTDFLSSMSHEIRTPLNAIVGFSEAITEEETLEAAKQDAKDIVLASQNLLEIVNGILDISKLEANKVEIINTEYNLKEECENLIKLIKPRLGEKPIELKLTIAKDLPTTLYGDKSKIKEIMSNLLTNAAKYTEKGTIECNVGCINKNDECSLIISVEDTGRGIKPDKIDKLFTKFERLDEDRNTTIEGAGLGLAITKRLVELMNGKIVVQSVFGSGTKFTFYVKQKITKTKREIKKIESNSILDLNGKDVLIVDDNELNIKIVKRLLEGYGINTKTCNSGFECIELLKSNTHFDLILMDDMMPKMTGTETLHILKEMPSFKDKIVVLTANAIEGMKEKYIEEGFDDYLSKPIEKNELERVLRKYLNKEIEHIPFDPLPTEFFEISDKIVAKMNSNQDKDSN